MYQILFTRQAVKDVAKIKSAKLDRKLKTLLDVIRQNPQRSPPPCERLIGDLRGLYSRRINIQHRLVYEIDEVQRRVIIRRCWTRCE